jgi:hypothetical protein
MSNRQLSPKDIIKEDLVKYKICAGKGCTNEGVHSLGVIYINKKGLFCDNCKRDLESYGLIDTQFDDIALRERQ